MWQPGMTLAQLEKEAIYEALKFFNGNKVQTASALGIAHRTLYNKLDVYEKGEANVGGTEEGKLQGQTGPEANGLQAKPGLSVESNNQVPQEQSVPVRKREKVQKMSSR